jgi:hypothetical protein
MALVIAGTVLEYDAYRQKLDAEAARDKSKDPPTSKTDPEKKGLPQ